MTRKILAPHKEQDGWVYVRVNKNPLLHRDGTRVTYNDRPSYRRIISSRRVEQAVETWDYLQLCAEEGLRAVFNGYLQYADRRGGWYVMDAVESAVTTQANSESGTTLREAYHRYKAKEGNRP